MALELDFILNDESVNRYGYRVLTMGIQTGNFEKNPVCLVVHDNHQLSIGKWKNLRKEGNLFKATLEFDEEDSLAVTLYKKYKNGYMSAVSMSFLEIAESEAPELLIKGQKYATITECELTECSLVNVPGNANALKLFTADGKEKQLSLIGSENQNPKTMQKNEKTAEELGLELETLRKNRALDLVSLHLDRGVIAAEEKEFFLKNAELDFDATKKVLEFRKTPEKDNSSDALADQLVTLHFDRGAIVAEEKEFFLKSAKLDYAGTKKVLELKKGKETLDALTQNLGLGKDLVGKDDRSTWSYLDFYKKDLNALQLMKEKEPERHSKLLAAHTLSLKESGEYVLDEK